MFHCNHQDLNLFDVVQQYQHILDIEMLRVNLVENILNAMDYLLHFEVRNQLKQLLQLKVVNIQVDYHEVRIILKLSDNVMMLMHVNVFDVLHCSKIDRANQQEKSIMVGQFT